MKLLFTGSNGFLGKNLIPTLMEKNFQVKTLSTKNSDYNVDISREIPILDFAPEIVFHAAGKAHSLPKNEIENKIFFDVNVDGTKNLCKALIKSGLPKYFFFISSVAVYGAEKGTKISESHPIQGETSYAKSKILGEEFLKKWCIENKVILYILRPSLISGKNPPGNLGDMIAAIDSGKYANIGGGKAQKSIVNAIDFVQIIEKGLQNNGGIYNVCDDHPPTFYKLSSAISGQLMKKKPISIPYFTIKIAAIIGDLIGAKFPINSNKLAKITNTLTFSNDKIKRELGFQPSSVIDQLQL